MLAPLLLNIFFAAVINVPSTYFKADKDIIDALVHLRKKRGAGGQREATAGESVLATPLWGMLHADDAGVVSQSPGQLMKMMGVIVVVFAAKTEITCFTRVGDAGVHRRIQRIDSGPCVQPDERVCIPRGERRAVEQGAEHFMAKWIAAEKDRAGLRHAVICPNVTGRTKERIAQSKRARAGSLALVD